MQQLVNGVTTVTPGSERRRYRRQYIAGTPAALAFRDEQQHSEAAVLRSRTAARAAARLAMLKLTHAFYTWRRASSGATIWRESAQAQALLAQAERIVHNRTHRHFRAWLDYLIMVRQEWIAEEHMLASTMLGVFAAWLGVVERSCTLREGMMNMYLRRAMLLLRTSLEQLAIHGAACRYRRAGTIKAARHLHTKILGETFARWADVVGRILNWREELLRDVWTRWHQLASRSGYIERRAHLLQQRRQLHHKGIALRLWSEWSRLHRRMAMAVMMFERKRKETTVVVAIKRWTEYTARANRNAYALARAAALSRRSLLRKIWIYWNGVSTSQLLQRRKMLAGLYRRQQYTGFHAWLEYARRCEEKRWKLGKSVACANTGCVGSSWRAWFAFTRATVHTKQVLHRTLNAMLKKRLHRVLAAWAGSVSTARSTRSARDAKLTRALSKLKYTLLVVVWCGWTDR